MYVYLRVPRFVGRGSAQRRAKGWLGSKSSPSKEAGDPVDFPPAGVGEAPKGDGKFVPWGKHIPRKESVNYYVATGEQECKLCRRIILTSQNAGRSFYSLCQLELPEYKDMCHAQQKVLQGCPEFSNGAYSLASSKTMLPRRATGALHRLSGGATCQGAA